MRNSCTDPKISQGRWMGRLTRAERAEEPSCLMRHDGKHHGIRQRTDCDKQICGTG